MTWHYPQVQDFPRVFFEGSRMFASKCFLTNFPGYITLKGNLCIQNPAVWAAVIAKRQE